jgi:hypothetical protein
LTTAGFASGGSTFANRNNTDEINDRRVEITSIKAYPKEDKNTDGGTSIEYLLKQRQNEAVEQIMIDKIDENPEVEIEEILEEYNQL